MDNHLSKQSWDELQGWRSRPTQRMGKMSKTALSDVGVPAWVPMGMCNYLDHARVGTSLREIARRGGVSPSTVLRQVRRVEGRREDPLLDAALETLVKSKKSSLKQKDTIAMTAPLRTTTLMTDAMTLAFEARRVLRRLAEPGAILAVAQGLEKAAVLREYPDGTSNRTAVLDQTVAQAFALKDWIVCRSAGKVARYEITAVGRAALRRYLTEDEAAGMAEAPQVFAGQHRIWAEKSVAGEAGEPARRLRYNLAESPVAALGRRRDKDGVPFLTPEQIGAGERLREDFEIAQMGPRVAQNWDRFLTGGARGDFNANGSAAEGPRDARERVAVALRTLGPGLGDMALRCCCYLEGLEAAEKRLGWSARSGKVVLRIALDRLAQHYSKLYGVSGPPIG